MPVLNLTFDAVDDLVGAHVQGKLPAPLQTRFSPSRIGPLIELTGHASNGRVGPLLSSDWLDRSTQTDLRVALTGDTNLWLDGPKLRGFMRGTYSPLEADHVRPRAEDGFHDLGVARHLLLIAGGKATHFGGAKIFARATYSKQRHLTHARIARNRMGNTVARPREKNVRLSSEHAVLQILVANFESESRPSPTGKHHRRNKIPHSVTNLLKR